MKIDSRDENAFIIITRTSLFVCDLEWHKPIITSCYTRLSTALCSSGLNCEAATELLLKSCAIFCWKRCA